MTATMALAVAALTGCVERVPSELRPAISPMENLPVDICTEAALNPLPASVRNIGDDELTIASVAFAADPDQPDGLASFDAPSLDKTSLLAEEEAFIQFTYRSPGGVSQQAILVVTSDAAVNPTLEIPVSTSPITEDQRALINCN